MTPTKLFSIVTLALAALTVLLLAFPADAKDRPSCGFARGGESLCPGAENPSYGQPAPGLRSAKGSNEGRYSRQASSGAPEPSYGGEVVGHRSGSCLKFSATRYLWCGCGSADEVGLDNSDGFWNLAGNWLTLPRAEPGYNMAIANYRHVAILKSHVRGRIWIAYDPNSGGQLARLHEVDIGPYHVVNPHGQPERKTRYHRRYAARGGSRS